MDKKILTIVGARPQFIKAAPVSRALRKRFKEVIVNTGQHYDYNMAGVFFEELDIPKPDYDLGVGSASHGKQTGIMLEKIEELLISENPNAVLVYGDTNSTLAGALAASKLHIPLIHIEAGLRSFNKQMPEEINRILTDHVSSLLFAPTETAVRNLNQEGITEHVHNVGDVMYDAVLYNQELASKKYNIGDFGLKEKSYFLITIHRAENTDSLPRLSFIVEALMQMKDEVILPLHPRTKNRLEQYDLMGTMQSNSNIKIIEPLTYLEMLILEKNAKGIITDSGGVQKEAYFMQIPCYTLRDETEWIETVETGWNRLIDPEIENLSEIITSSEVPSNAPSIFGDGNSSDLITQKIDEFLK